MQSTDTMSTHDFENDEISRIYAHLMEVPQCIDGLIDYDHDKLVQLVDKHRELHCTICDLPGHANSCCWAPMQLYDFCEASAIGWLIKKHKESMQLYNSM